MEIRDELARRDLADAEAKRTADAERRRVAIETAPLLDFVPLASPKLVAPRHLALRRAVLPERSAASALGDLQTLLNIIDAGAPAGGA